MGKHITKFQSLIVTMQIASKLAANSAMNCSRRASANLTRQSLNLGLQNVGSVRQSMNLGLQKAQSRPSGIGFKMIQPRGYAKFQGKLKASLNEFCEETANELCLPNTTGKLDQKKLIAILGASFEHCPDLERVHKVISLLKRVARRIIARRKTAECYAVVI